MLRFRLITVFVLVAVSAVGCAAFVAATDIWRQTMVTTVLFVLGVSTLAAICCEARAKALAIGFSVAGWLYFTLTFVGALNLRSDLLTDRAVEWLGSAIHGEHDQVVSVAFTPQGNRLVSGKGDGWVRLWDASTGRPVRGANVPAENLRDIGHALWTLIFALLGAVVAAWLHRRNRDRDKDIDAA